MPDYVEALRLLSKLPKNLNGLFMEDNKTITMPLSEYRRMEEEVALFRNGINPYEEELKDWKRKYDELNEQFAKYSSNQFEVEINHIRKIASLEDELKRIKSGGDYNGNKLGMKKKWYQFWK